MASSYNKFNVTVADFANGSFNLASDTVQLLLTNTVPNAADTIIDTTTSTCTVKSTSNAGEIAAGNGYSKTGSAVTITTNSQTSGTYTLAGNQVQWTASGGTIGALRYAVLYDITAATSSTRPVFGWWDYGSSVTLNSGDSFTVEFNSANPGTIFTIA